MTKPLVACAADLACYRSDGHEEGHAYADGRLPEPVVRPRTHAGRIMVEEVQDDHPEFREWVLQSVLDIEAQSLPSQPASTEGGVG